MSGPPPASVFDRWWAQVAKGDPDDCWEWTGTRDVRGYGKIGVKEGDRWSSRLAHRVGWMLAVGPLDAGLCVLHHCDNPPCCNLAHLFVGTIADNNADMRAKGRAGGNRNRGEASATHKLSDADVAEIRTTYEAGGVTQRPLAARFGITQAQVSNIVRRRQRI